MNKVILKIVGMHCTSCALTIDLDLEELPGVKSSSTNFAKSITEVEFDEEKTSLDELLSIVSKSGYTAII